MATKGFIYVITDGVSYKIGKAKNVVQRLTALQTGNKTKLTLLWYKEYPDYSKAEAALHALFSAYRRNGEWFSLDRQSKVLLEKIFTGIGLTERERQSLERLGLL